MALLGREEGRPLVIGHRGAPAAAPENTLASFAAALAAGADAVELDVGAGLQVAHSEREAPEAPLHLDEALEFLRPSDAGVLVDLKRAGIEREVAAALRRHGLVERALVSSHSPRSLRRLAAADPALLRAISYPNDRFRASRLAWPRSLTAATAAFARAAMPARAPLLIAAGGTHVLSLHHALVSAALVRRLCGRGAAVIAWTANDPDRIAALAGLGVSGVVTDDPGLARRVLATLGRT